MVEKYFPWPQVEYWLLLLRPNRAEIRSAYPREARYYRADPVRSFGRRIKVLGVFSSRSAAVNHAHTYFLSNDQRRYVIYGDLDKPSEQAVRSTGQRTMDTP